MPESFIQLPADSSGKKSHTFQRTIGANTIDTSVALVGEQYLASYTAQGGMQLATASSHLMQIMAGASLRVRIRRIEVYGWTLATTAAIWACQIVRLTTAGTGGTVVTTSPLDPADSASGATAMTLPTAKGTEGVFIASATQVAQQTVATNGAMSAPLVFDFDGPRRKPLIIAAGASNGIAVRNSTGIAAAAVFIDVYFDEANF